MAKTAPSQRPTGPGRRTDDQYIQAEYEGADEDHGDRSEHQERCGDSHGREHRLELPASVGSRACPHLFGKGEKEARANQGDEYADYVEQSEYGSLPNDLPA